jgi:hypothetical protein
MLRPPTPAAIERLARAAHGSDRDLDRALSDVGVLPPCELDEIRDILSRPDTHCAIARNDDGHSIIQVVWNCQLSALVHNDGHVQVLTTC